MVTKIGINGFGRIGRLTLRTINQYHQDKQDSNAPLNTAEHLYPSSL